MSLKKLVIIIGLSLGVLILIFLAINFFDNSLVSREQVLQQEGPQELVPGITQDMILLQDAKVINFYSTESEGKKGSVLIYETGVPSYVVYNAYSSYFTRAGWVVYDNQPISNMSARINETSTISINVSSPQDEASTTVSILVTS